MLSKTNHFDRESSMTENPRAFNTNIKALIHLSEQNLVKKSKKPC